MIYLENNVFDEALNRIRFVFDEFDDVIVMMSGGKDSTVIFNLALMVAREKNRLPMKVFWLDQECEWQNTVDYMEKIMTREDVKPYWYQIPFDFTNSLSPEKNFITIWNPDEKDLWCHPQSDISIKENPTKYNRFHELINRLPGYCANEPGGRIARIGGIKENESLGRRLTIHSTRYTYKGRTWVRKPTGNCYCFYPIYDFTDNDVWTAIAKNRWEYNKIYDYQYQVGVGRKKMRVSALIHETSWQSIEMLQEFEPETYNKFVRRVKGTSTYNHLYDMNEIIPKELPFAFKDWKEYRDYLLVHITKPEYWNLFRERWKKQNTEAWYKIHVKEILINDIDGTINKNEAVKFGRLEDTKAGGKCDKMLIDEMKKVKQEARG